MTATLQPFGLRPAYSPQGMAAAPGIVGGIASGYATSIKKYQAVMLATDGTIVIATAGSDTPILGSFAGVSWVDANGVLHSDNDFYSCGFAILCLGLERSQPSILNSMRWHSCHAKRRWSG